MPEHRVTVHHEGAGAPTDTDRCKGGGYVVAIGRTAFKIWRRVRDAFATKGFNGRSVDVVFTGHRGVHNVTDADLALLREAFAELRRRGEVVDTPDVVQHGDVRPTDCPGSKARERWGDIVAACFAPTVDLSWLANATPEQVAFLEAFVPLSHDERAAALKWIASVGAGGTPTPPPPPVPPAPAPVSKPTLRRGSKGAHVREVQRKLNGTADARLRVDGVFGHATHRAVVNVQRFFGLAADGVVGRDTWALLDYLAAHRGVR